MTEDGLKENKLASCCISHEFYKAASKSPNKIAVVHAYGGIKIATEFRKIYSNNGNQTTISDVNDDSSFLDEFFANKTLSSHPLVYEGDQCFTYSEILSAVDSLSFRLRRILDGGDDPHLIKATSGDFPGKQSPHVQIFSSSTSTYLGVEPITHYHNTFTPRIVGIYMAPSVEYIIAVLSVLRCGEAFMPLDPSWPQERVLQVVSSSEADLIIVRESSIDGNFGHQGDKLYWLVDSCRCSLLYISMEDKLQHQVSSSRLLWPCRKKKLRPFCYLMYTSGSTGKPKGVCGTEIGLVNRFLWMQNLYPLHGEESLLFKTSISFIDHLQEFLGALLTTSTLIIPPFNVLKENLFYVVDLIQAYSINRLVAVPSLMRAILPALQIACNMGVQSSLNLLVLSGEVLYLDLLGMLVKLLPNTAILNLYGSTEVAGDCTYFDCKRLPLIMDSEKLSSVPIGLPVSNCDVVLVGEDAPTQGEIYVRGLCTCVGYFCYSSIMPLDHVLLPQDSCFGRSCSEHKSQYYFRTGDFARKLQSGDLVFLGRTDRSIKINGQRIALEEIESTLREHPDVVDAAVISHNGQGEVTVLEAYLMTKQKDESGEGLISSIRSWMISKVPLAMIPSHFFFTQSFPMSSTGKVEYTSLASSTRPMRHVRNEIEESGLLQVIKKTFCDVLMVEKVSDDDNFFEMGGTSISAAHASYNLGIDMRLLYAFPNPLKLQLALLEEERLSNHDLRIDGYLGVDVKMPDGCSLLSFDSRTSDKYSSKPRGRLVRTLSNIINPDYPTKYLKMDSNSCMKSKDQRPKDGYFWDQSSIHMACSFSRCNNVVREGEYEGNTFCHAVWSLKTPSDQKGCMKRLWQVHMESCVDASPLVVFKERDILVFIGSHSHKFLCINAKSGLVQWEIKLEGRIECSAAIVDNFSQVIVGCYQGNIYFLDFLNGSICWTFQTCGQVKSQPLVDECRHLVWCGSYDHNLYALDYRNYGCIYKLPCGGSVFGSPAIDKVHDILYVASTSGRLTAISIKAMPFSKLWLLEFGAPIFGSISINSCNGNVICCLVDGHVVAVDTSGSIIWKGKTGGPIFAGPCISRTLASQVLICSRDGSIYSFELESGDLLWEHNVGDPITSSAYVDENLQLISDVSHLSDRLICVTASSGSIHLLRINLDAVGEAKRLGKDVVQEFARLDLQGDIFSSPVMIGGRIFVGCRDDFVHCIEVGVEITM